MLKTQVNLKVGMEFVTKEEKNLMVEEIYIQEGYVYLKCADVDDESMLDVKLDDIVSEIIKIY